MDDEFPNSFSEMYSTWIGKWRCPLLRLLKCRVNTTKMTQHDQQQSSGTVSCSQVSLYEVCMFSLPALDR